MAGMGMGTVIALAAAMLALLQWQSDGAAWYSLFGSQGKVPWHASQMIRVLKWASWSNVLKLAMAVGIASLFPMFRKAWSLNIAVLLAYTLAWSFLACVLSGKFGSECNYFLPAMAGVGGCLVTGAYRFVANVPTVAGVAVVLVLVLCAALDMSRLPGLVKAQWSYLPDQDRMKRELAADLQPYSKVLARHCDILCSQGKPVFMVDHFTVRMLTIAGWYQPSGIYQAVRDKFYDAAMLDTGLREKAQDEKTMYWLPGLALDTFKYYQSAGINHGPLNTLGTVMVPRLADGDERPARNARGSSAKEARGHTGENVLNTGNK